MMQIFSCFCCKPSEPRIIPVALNHSTMRVEKVANRIIHYPIITTPTHRPLHSMYFTEEEREFANRISNPSIGKKTVRFNVRGKQL